MRSSKSRSRSKQNRPRSIGNIVNRVFDSSGPEGKVRGTPQQIIEKYQTLARDAQLSNDRVAAENFLQHAEHYTRMLSEAMRELATEQESRRQQHGGNGNGQPQGGYNDRQGQNQRRDDRDDDQPDVSAPAFGLSDSLDDAESGLVETPEARQEPPAQAPVRSDDRPRNERRSQGEQQPRRERDDRRRDDRPRREERRPDPVAESAPEVAIPAPVASAPETAAVVPEPAPVADKPKRPRAPRKPRAETSPESAGKPEAAE